MELNVTRFIEKLEGYLGLAGKGAVSKLAMKAQIVPATIYNLKKSGKDFSVTTLIRLRRGLGMSWEKIGKMLEDEYKE